MVLQLFYTQKLKKKLFNLYGKKPQKGYPFLIYVAIFHSINSVVLTLTSHFKPPMVNTELARLATLNQNFEIFTQNKHLPAQRFFS